MNSASFGTAVGAVALTGAAVSAAAMLLTSKVTPIVPAVDLNDQSKLLPGPEGARTSKVVFEKEFASKYNVETLSDVLYSGMRLSNDGDCLGWREGKDSTEFKWLKYSQVIDKARCLGSAILDLGIEPGVSTLIGIYSKNCVEWVITEHGCYHYSMVVVPLYDTLGPTACSFIIQQAEMKLIICGDESKVLAILKQASETPTLKYIITFEEISAETKELAYQNGIQVISFNNIVERGRKNLQEPILPKPSYLATVCYTSGTTGAPKGVMLTHGSIAVGILSLVLSADEYQIGPNDTALSFLPLAHMMERCTQSGLYMVGARVGFYGGNVLELLEAMQALRPTITALVPRLMNRLYNKAKAGVSGSYLKERIMGAAVRSKTAELHRQVVRNNGFWDWLVFKKVRDAFGGRIRLMAVGSAPISDKVLTFTRAAMGCIIVEAYGQTECVAACTSTIVGDSTTEHVGPPLPGVTIKLVDVPEMNYLAENNQGEICVKGAIVFQGYYKDPINTAQALDSEGWLHTGDVGMWLPNGTLKVIDRKKHIFKLSQGEYIAPEKIESSYLKCALVSQIFIHGDSLKSTLVGILSPDIEEVYKSCRENGIVIANPDDIYKRENVKKLILTRIQAQGKEDGLKSFEQVKDIYLFNGTFSLENGLTTPTFKTKRPAMKEYFKSQIQAMYENLD